MRAVLGTLLMGNMVRHVSSFTPANKHGDLHPGGAKVKAKGGALRSVRRRSAHSLASETPPCNVTCGKRVALRPYPASAQQLDSAICIPSTHSHMIPHGRGSRLWPDAKRINRPLRCPIVSVRVRYALKCYIPGAVVACDTTRHIHGAML